MKSTLLSVFSLFIFVGCAPSSLIVQEQNGIVLEHNKQIFITQAKPLEKKIHRFMNLDITQIKLQNAQNESLFYEALEANHDYEFKYATVETIKRVLDVSRSHTLYQSSTLLFIQLQTKDAKWINLMAERSSNQTLSFVYGYTNSAFATQAKELSITLQTPHEEIFTPFASLTHWSQSDMFLNPLVQPMYRRLGDTF